MSEEKETRKEKRLKHLRNAGLLGAGVGGSVYLTGVIGDNLASRPRGTDPEAMKTVSGPLKKIGLGVGALGLGAVGLAEYKHHKYKKNKDAHSKE